MKERIYDFWAASLQNGYIGNIVEMTERAGGAAALYDMKPKEMTGKLGINEKLAGYIEERKVSLELLEDEYERLGARGICYVNYTDPDFPEKLSNIASRPYGIFVKGSLPDPFAPSVAIIGARQCSEYGRLMAQYFGDRLSREGVQIISGMAWGIDGIAQTAALDAGGRSFGVLGCGVDIVYPCKNRPLYNRLCAGGSGLISEYAPGTMAQARLFPPRNRIISALCDVLLVVEARAKSGTLITVDMANDQGKCVMVVPGRLTDNLSVGCLNLMYQGALPATSVESVLEQLNIKRQTRLSDVIPDFESDRRRIPEDLRKVYDAVSIEPRSARAISELAGLNAKETMIMLTRLETEGFIREVGRGFFVKIFHNFYVNR